IIVHIDMYVGCDWPTDKCRFEEENVIALRRRGSERSPVFGGVIDSTVPFRGVSPVDARLDGADRLLRLGRTVAMLVLLAAAAGTGLVRPNLTGPTRCARIRLVLGCVRRRIGGGDARLHRLLGDHRLDPEDRTHGVVLDVVQQLVEEAIPLSLVDDQRILLAVCLEPDAPTE